MEERLSTLLKYKEKYGDFNVPENHAVLGKWVDEQKKAAKKFAEEGDGTAFFDGKIKELIALGFKVDIEEAAADDKDILNGWWVSAGGTRPGVLFWIMMMNWILILLIMTHGT